MRDCALENGLGPEYFNTLRAWARENRVPLSATFELTPLCNFSCVMCYVRLTPEQARAQGRMLSAGEWLELGRQAREMGTLFLCLTGGEPLTRPDFWEIYAGLNQMGFLISLLSNASLLDEGAMEKFREYGMPYSVKLTLYGASDETYWRTCGVRDGFSRIKRAVALLKAQGVPLTMTGTMVRENAEDLQALYSTAREWGVAFQHTTAVLRSARGAVNTTEVSRFAFDEFLNGWENVDELAFNPTEIPFAHCKNYGTGFLMTWQGHMQQCTFMSHPYVAFNGIMAENWLQLNKLLDALKDPVACGACEHRAYCLRCPGMLNAESGDPEKTADTICRVAERVHKLMDKNREEAKR